MSQSKTKEKDKPKVAAASAATETGLAVAKPTVAESFVAKVMKHFTAQLGDMVEWGPYQRMLAQHLYIKIDNSLKELQSKGKAVHWGNVNMVKLAVDAVHVVNLGLDGLLRNHVDVIPYKNGALTNASGTTMYDLAIRPGYRGKLYSYQRASTKPIRRVIVQLLFEGDTFVPKFSPSGDSYEYVPKDVFREDENIVGGFTFLAYEDERNNKLVPVTMRDFKKSQSSSKARVTTTTNEDGEVVTSGNFWKDWYPEMCEKTCVHRGMDAVELSPEFVNGVSMTWVREQEAAYEEALMAQEDEEEANGVTVGFSDDRSDAKQESGETSSTPDDKPDGEQSSMAELEEKPF